MAAGICLILNSINELQQPSLPLIRGVEGVSLCIEEVLTAKANANRTARYVKSLGYYLRQFASGREKKPLAEFTFQDVESWLEKYPSAYTRQTWLNRLSTLFAFAMRRGYISSNPCERIERITIDKKPPVVLEPDQARILLAASPGVMRPYVILGMFAGIRPEEIQRLDWSQINLERGTVLVEGKTRKRRLVQLEPVAIELLKKHPLQQGPVCPSDTTIDRWRIVARRALHLQKWPQDLLRHTAASYLIALHKDAGKVALMLGNSEKILLAHYHEPVTDEACAEFWSHQPKTQKTDALKCPLTSFSI